MNYKAIIFDLDGTLIDSLDDLADAVNRSLEYYEFPTHDNEAYKYFIGNGMYNLVKRALPQESRTNDNIDKCYKKAKEEYDECWAVKTQLYPGISQLLDEITKRNLPMAILSNKPHEFTELVVDKYLHPWKFQIAWGARPDVPIKPDPTAANEIVSQLKMKPAEVLYLGDSKVDMETAKNAGLYGVGVLWGFRTADELLQYGAKKLIEKPAELLAIIDKK